MEVFTKKLHEEKSVNSDSLFKHLQKVIKKIVREHNEYARNLEFFEVISDFVKKNSLNYSLPMSDNEVNNIKI